MSRLKNKTKTLYLTHRILFLAMLFLAIGGSVMEIVYNNSPKHAISTKSITKVLNQQELKAETTMKEIQMHLANGNKDSLSQIIRGKKGIVFWVFKNNQLLFWSDNQAEPQNLKSPQWQFVALSNAYGIARSMQSGDYNIIACIPLKHNYPYENEDLKNVFFNGLHLNKDIGFSTNKSSSPYAIYSIHGNYLFSLVLPIQPVYNEKLAVYSMILFMAAFLLLFYLFAHLPLLQAKRTISWKSFLIASVGLSLLVFLCLNFEIPATFFRNKIFTPFHYASDSLVETLTHLTFLSLYFASLIFLFCVYLKDETLGSKFIRVKQIVLLLLPGCYFFFIFQFLVGVVYNTSMDINILRFEDFSLVSVWNHLLFLIWGISFMMLHQKTHFMLLRKMEKRQLLFLDCTVTFILCVSSYFLLDRYKLIFIGAFIGLSAILYIAYFHLHLMKNRWFLAGWLLIYAFFVTFSSTYMNQNKKFEKYRTIAQNYYLNDEKEEDRLALALFEDLSKSIKADKRIKRLVQFPDSIEKANRYINNVYLKGFWNKYEMKLFATIPDTKLDKEFRTELESFGKKVGNSNFYTVHIPASDMTFLGAFHLNSRNRAYNFYMEFYPKKTYKSYSFPNLLLETPPSIQTQLKLSTARYAFNELVSSSGNFKYSSDAKWIKKRPDIFFTQKYQHYKHYIYQYNRHNYYVLSEEDVTGFWRFTLYFVYVFLAYLFLTFIFNWLYDRMYKQTKIRHTFSSKFLVSFTVLLVLSFVLIFYVSMNYTRQKYIDGQKQRLEITKSYIQNALQEKYPWREKLDSTLTNELNADLQDLSYIYKTDIHVYDNQGKLIASSQMPLFTRGLISRQISPVPYFSNNGNLTQYERIGQLEYLTAYADFYNMDFLPIGYIAVPLFLSHDQLQADLESFLSMIVHIYLIIILLFLALSLIIGRQLSSPLLMLQESLKQIKLGERTKKIKYKPHDEIGQLVEQYNRTVEELEISARLLAKSERESAWQSMAHQVAHEINNPLTPMKLTIQQLQRRKAMNDEQFDEYFEKSSKMLIEQIENLSRIASTFSTFAKLPEAQFNRVDVAATVSSTVTLFTDNLDNIEISYKGLTSGVYCMADKEQLIQVFNNLLKNAVQSIPSGQSGKIEVLFTTEEKWIEIQVKDNGKGIEEEVKGKLFTPNFTTKSTGMGLGLSISRNIILAHGGTITFDSKAGEGTTFTVTLPRIS